METDAIRIPLGRTEKNHLPVLWNVTKSPHMWLIGDDEPANVKTLKWACTQAMREGWQSVTLDPAGRELGQWECRQLAYRLNGDPSQVRYALKWLKGEYDQRTRTLKNEKAANIRCLPNEKRPDRILVAFAGLGTYLSNSNVGIDNLATLLKHGGRAGIHIMLDTHPDEIPNIMGRLALQDEYDRLVIMDNRAYWEPNDSDTPVETLHYKADDDILARSLKNVPEPQHPQIRQEASKK